MEHQSDMLLDVQSIRLFPKNQGADAYLITGIAARCDCVILSDAVSPHIHVHKNVSTRAPRHIFLSMRSPFVAITFFANQVLPTLNSNFVLITGSEDITIPQQHDRRFRKFNEVEIACINRILNNPYLSHWFCENLDDASNPVVSPFPTGMVYKQDYPKSGIAIPSSPPLLERPLRILCAHRIRDGIQWDARRQVTKLARSDWAQWCTVIEEEVSEDEISKLMREHAFVFCVEGGGLDPSPKAWQTILNGAIPIIRTSALKDAYRELPVAFVSGWESGSISTKILNDWRADFSQLHEDRSMNSPLVEKLGIDYWWNKVLAFVDDKSK